MSTFTVELEVEAEKVGSYRLKATSGNPILQTVYLMKSALGDVKPGKVTVTVEVE